MYINRVKTLDPSFVFLGDSSGLYTVFEVVRNLEGENELLTLSGGLNRP